MAWATAPKQPSASLDYKAFFKPELHISDSSVTLESVKNDLVNRSAWEGFLQERGGSDAVKVFIDPRSGAAVNVIAAFPLIPGDGVGNHVSLEGLGRSLGRGVTSVDSDVVAAAFLRFARAHAEILGIDASQLGRVKASQVTPELWQLHVPQQLSGIPVRDGRLLGSISHGNLVVIGTESWGDVKIDTAARLGAEDALAAGFSYAEGRRDDDLITREPRLEIVPLAPAEYQNGEAFAGPIGKGYEHRLIWSFEFQRPPDLSRWEVMVDAHNGEVLALQDKNLYAAQQVTGGVYPLTDTGQCPDNARCGTMQPGSPMPFANTGLASPNNFANSAGIFQWTSGTVTTTLSGKYFKMADNCGAVNESSTTGSLNLGGVNNQHDCTTAGSSAGDTPASRSGFYELNKLAEQARGWLPTNTWLQGQVTANMNLNLTCNAFWDPGTGQVNFYRSGGGCNNTGEIAAVFDHEWGHGLDDNDAAGVLSNSSEAYADVAAIYRLEASCVGYGFFATINAGCGQTSDGTGFNTNEALTGASYCATNCSGVRDTDFAKHTPATAATALGFVCGQCTTGTGPCGKQVHCAAAPVRQAAWDFVNRDLVAAPFSLDTQSAYIVGNKTFYQGSGNIGAWHSCTCGGTATGCAAANGYMQWLTADDDNGNLNDGTPHMTALFNAFNRHGIACTTPTAVNSGCASGPTAASTVTVTPGNFQNQVSWTSVAGATHYWVFRNEGFAGCSFGKTLIADVTTTSFTDTNVANGRAYNYNVEGVAAASACHGTISNCASATPTATADFNVSCSPASLTVQQGNSGPSTCTVSSSGGFASAVNLSCANLPAGVSCSYAPTSVTPPANGSANSALTVAVSGTATAGTSTFQATGTSGTTTHTFNVSITVTTAPTPDFSISAAPSSVSVAQGANNSSTITVASLNGFSAATSLSASGLPSGVTAAFVPSSVTPPSGSNATSTLTFTASATATTGTASVTVTGTSGSLTHNTSISLTVTPTGGGGGAQTAVFDATLKAPKCGTVGSSCDSGAALLLGRDGKGPEPNQPNTINSSCADGTSGTFHSDESNDALKVTSVDGTNFTAGKQVRVDATVWAWTTPAQDHLDLYFAPDATAPVWTLIATLNPTVVGAQTLSATYTLPSGGANQAVRANFRYQGSAAVCGTNSGFDDHDDLVFAVTVSAPTPDFSISAAPSSVSVVQGAGNTSTITVASLNGFSAATSLSASGLPSGVTAAFVPSSVTPPSGSNATSTLTFTASATATTGTASVTVTGTSGSLTHNTSISLTVTPTGGGPQTAVFDATLKAPKCGTAGSSCDSGASLLLGRDGKGPEPNQPNTINTSCADGTAGTFHSDESNDRIKVSTTDGTTLAAGKTVRVDATVWAWTTPSQDHLDLYFAANANSPTWTLIGTLSPTVAGAQTLSATYTLPAGALQAVRAHFRYQGAATSCSTGTFDDHDDLVFAAQ